MIPTGDLEQRLQSNIKADVYELVRPPNQALVEEITAAGEANVGLVLPEGCLAIRWVLPTGLFRVLQEESNADGAFILRLADGSHEAHVVECKKTVNGRDWAKARKQMRWTLSRLRGLAGILGIELRRGVLYTAFRTDDLSPDSAPNPIAQRRPLGPEAGATDVENPWPQRILREWVDDDLILTGFDGRFVHRKIQLDDQGVGSARFACE
jgi:hypothetical protein